jgi:hypothetical protein
MMMKLTVAYTEIAWDMTTEYLNNLHSTNRNGLLN